MNAPLTSFEELVAIGWSNAVAEAAHRFPQARDQVISSLNSKNPEVRSAAIAALNEANDETAHDQVVALADDPDSHVREEVFEYIEQFPKEADATLLLTSLKAGKNGFLASSALRKLFGNEGPLIDDEELKDGTASVSEWERILHARGLGA